MRASSAIGHAGRALYHLGSGRWLEVLLLQGSPLLGVAFGDATGAHRPVRMALLALGSVLLTAHVFAFNDWAGYRCDLNDPRRAGHVFAQRGIASHAVAALAVALLAISLAALAALGFLAAVLGAAIACVGVLYSSSASAFKGVPLLASLLHFVGGGCHFLLGYSVAQPIDGRGLALAAFCGLVFAGGHLNQEVRDHDADRHNGIRTSAVSFGPRRALLASLAVFSAAYAALGLNAWIGLAPRPVAWTALLWPFHLGWTLRALRREPGFDEARWLQRRYRFLFGIVGLVILAALWSGSPRQ